jgi:hypothetical protein
MFTYTLILAMFLLFVSWWWKRMLIFVAVFVAWGGVIWIIAIMSQTQDMSASEPIQYVSAVIMLWSLLQFLNARRGNIA